MVGKGRTVYDPSPTNSPASLRPSGLRDSLRPLRSIFSVVSTATGIDWERNVLLSTGVRRAWRGAGEGNEGAGSWGVLSTGIDAGPASVTTASTRGLSAANPATKGAASRPVVITAAIACPARSHFCTIDRRDFAAPDSEETGFGVTPHLRSSPAPRAADRDNPRKLLLCC